jgi:hypothetical protein
MATRTQRSNAWFVIMIAVLVVAGICVIGYWQSYDIKCAGGQKEWNWKQVPPQFVCPVGTF